MQMYMIMTASFLIANSFPNPKINFCHARGCYNTRKIGKLISERMRARKKIIKLLRINLKPFIFIFSDSLLKVRGTNQPAPFCSVKLKTKKREEKEKETVGQRERKTVCLGALGEGKLGQVGAKPFL